MRQPKFLYKYINSEGLLNILKNLSIKCSPAVLFNDPFDCTPPFLFSKDCDKNCIIINKYGSSCEGYIKSVSEKCYVSCFTTNPCNILMWGHYTDSYRGGVIKFKRDIFMLKHTQKVNYSNHVQTISSEQCFSNSVGNTNNKTLHELLYLNKSNCWKYEQEWRFCSHIYSLKNELSIIDLNTINDPIQKKKINKLRKALNKNNVIIPIINNDIDEIYIGFRNEQIDRIRNILEQNRITAKVYVVKPENNSYVLKRERLL